MKLGFLRSVVFDGWAGRASQLKMVRDCCNKRRIGGLASVWIRAVPEILFQYFNISPGPANFNGVTNGPLHSGWRGAEVFGYLGVEHLGDGVACLTARWWATKACCVPFGFIAFFIVPYLTTLRV